MSAPYRAVRAPNTPGTLPAPRGAAAPGVARRAVARWLAPVPVERSVVVRTVIVGYALVFLLARSVYLRQAAGLPAAQWRPVGLFTTLDAPPPPWMIGALWGAGVAAAVAVLADRARRAALAALAAAMLVVETYDTSWGQLFHTGHLVTLHLLVLAGAALLEPATVTGRAERPAAPPAGSVPSGGSLLSGASVLSRPSMVSGWPLRLLSAVTVLTYLIAGVAKLRLGGGAWLDGAALRNQVAYDNIRKELVGSVSSPVAGLVLAHTWWWWPIALATLAVELGAPAALVWRPLRRWWVMAAWVFHVGIVGLMAIVFAYPLSGAAYVSLLEPERYRAVRPLLHGRPRRPRRTVKGRTTP